MTRLSAPAPAHGRAMTRSAHTCGRRGRLRGDRGSVTVETVTFVLPVTVIIVLLGIFCFRLAGSRLDLDATAAAAARAASLARTPAAAQDEAATTATQNLAEHHRTCNPLTVMTDTSNFRRGGSVTVTIGCTVATADLIGLSAPGTVASTASATAVIDTYRQVDPA